MQEDLIPKGYNRFLADLKARIQQTQVRSALAVSHELIGLYWEIGRDLEQAVATKQWGAKVVEQIATDLKAAFPGVAGFSRANLYRMRAFYQAYPEENQKVAQAVRQIPWGHNVVLLQKLKDPDLRLWYAQKTSENGWSRSILAMQIESKVHERQGRALSNFAQTLPPLQSDLAQQILKDPYNFDFLTLGEDAHERAVEQGLLEHLKQFLLELGVGFAFVGSQYHLEVDGDDFYIDLLFYHLKLRAFIVIELKARDFSPGDAGQLQMYVAAVDDLLKHNDDQPTLGLILCRGKKALTVEYTLRGTNVPIGVADYLTTDVLPDDLKRDLPTVAEIEAELKNIAALAKRVQARQADDAPAQLTTPGRRALYHNVGQNEALALKLDETVKQVRPDGWRGVQAREQTIKAALYGVLQDVDEVERIFPIIVQQGEY